MPMPLWWGHVNKVLFNGKAVRTESWPILTHVGRHSGEIRRTPLGPIAVDGGYVFILVYGSGADWVQNVMAAGTAELRIDGEDIALRSPKLLHISEAIPLLPPGAKLPPRFLNVTEYLLMENDG